MSETELLQAKYEYARAFQQGFALKIMKTREYFTKIISNLKDIYAKPTDIETRENLSKLHMYNDKMARDSLDLGFYEGTANELGIKLKRTKIPNEESANKETASKEGGSRKSRNRTRRR